MQEYLDVHFSAIRTKDSGVPYVVLTPRSMEGELLIALNSFDANRLGLSALRFMDVDLRDVISELIAALEGELLSVSLERDSDDRVAAYLAVRTVRGISRVEVRPGEGIFSAVRSGVPLRAARHLFQKYSKEGEEISLEKRILQQNTDELGTFRLQ
ncbi:MAG: hypothetical protein ACQEQV_06365 [Fibrobacterota bacterium]